MMNKWHVYDFNDELTATIETDNVKVVEGVVMFADHLGAIAIYPPHAFNLITRADWEESN